MSSSPACASPASLFRFSIDRGGTFTDVYAELPACLGGGWRALKVLSGPAAGREVPLSKVVTTIGKPGVAVAAITRHA